MRPGARSSALEVKPIRTGCAKRQSLRNCLSGSCRRTSAKIDRWNGELPHTVLSDKAGLLMPLPAEADEQERVVGRSRHSSPSVRRFNPPVLHCQVIATVPLRFVSADQAGRGVHPR